MSDDDIWIKRCQWPEVWSEYRETIAAIRSYGVIISLQLSRIAWRQAKMGVFAKNNKKLSSNNAASILIGVDPLRIRRAIEATIVLKSVLSVSATKDGKSIKISVYDGESNEIEYATDATELEELLNVIIEAAGLALPDDPPSPPVKPEAAQRRASTK